jgi:putative endonuclease
MLGGFTKTIVRGLDRAARTLRRSEALPAHLSIGRRGEDDAYFFLRQQGYTLVARNWRSPRLRGEIDLIGWDGDVLCFIEVKARSAAQPAADDVHTPGWQKPAEAAVDRDKQRQIALVARDYLRKYAARCPIGPAGRTYPPCRFDVVSAYYGESNQASLTLFRNAFSVHNIGSLRSGLPPK